MNLGITEAMKEFFDISNLENQLLLPKRNEPKQECMVNSEKIDLNQQEIRNLYVSLSKT